MYLRQLEERLGPEAANAIGWQGLYLSSYSRARAGAPPARLRLGPSLHVAEREHGSYHALTFAFAVVALGTVPSTGTRYSDSSPQPMA